MSKRRWKRKKLLVDIRIQGALAVRVVLYWLLYLVSIGTVLLVWRAVSSPFRPVDSHVTDLLSLYGPAAAVSLLLLPLVLYDLMGLTNRFVGPVFRMRRAMRELAQGGEMPDIKLRDGDFWQDFATDFNVVAGRLRELSRKAEEEASVLS